MGEKSSHESKMHSLSLPDVSSDSLGIGTRIARILKTLMFVVLSIVLEDIECKDSYDSNLDESSFLVTPLSNSNEDGYFATGDDVELLLHRDPSTPMMSVASILEGFIDEPPLEENDDLFDLESKNDEWKKILYDAPIDDLMTEDKVFDPEIHDQIFLQHIDDKSLSDEDVSKDNVKIYSNPIFEFDDEYISSDVNPLFDEEKVLVITALKDTLSKLKGKTVVDEAITLHPIDPELLKIDVAPLAPKLRNNMTAHYDYLKHTQEETVTLREIVENERLIHSLNTSLVYACKYTKRIQELLIILKQTCPCINDLGTKLMAVTLVDNNKKIRVIEHITTSGNKPIKTPSFTNVVSNKPVLSSTEVNLPTSASGSHPQGNTKKDRIQQTQSRAKKKKLEDHPRNVRPRLHNKKGVVNTKAISFVPNSKLNVNSNLKCDTCNGCFLIIMILVTDAEEASVAQAERLQLEKHLGDIMFKSTERLKGSGIEPNRRSRPLREQFISHLRQLLRFHLKMPYVVSFGNVYTCIINFGLNGLVVLVLVHVE
nr:hypothetical protein [Tanacetum cinerariifolium]